MSADNVYFRLVEQAMSLLRSDRVLVVFRAPATSDWIKELLRRFPNAGVVVNFEVEGATVSEQARIGRFAGPYLNEWVFPQESYQHAVVLRQTALYRLSESGTGSEWHDLLDQRDHRLRR